MLYRYIGQHSEALIHSEPSLTLNPYDGDLLVNHGQTLMYAGQAREAIPWMEKALRYNPQPPTYYWQRLVLAQFLAGDTSEALENLRRAESGSDLFRLSKISVLQASGQADEAAAEVDLLLSRQPKTTLQGAASMFVGFKRRSDVDVILNALRDAGLPDDAGIEKG